MSTRSALFIQTEDGDWLCHYCHYDGYPRHMEPALAKAKPEMILAAKELRAISETGAVDGFPSPRAPERMAQPEMPEWAEHAYLLTYPEGWRHATTTAALRHWASHACAPQPMPASITTPEGETYHATGYTGTALEAARRHGIEPGETTHEYWIEPDDDSRRLHAASPSRWFLD